MATFNGVVCEIVFDLTLPRPAEEEKERPGFWKNPVLGEWRGKAAFASKADFNTAKETNRDQIDIVGDGSNIEIYGSAILTETNEKLLTIDFVGNGVPSRCPKED